MYTLPSSTRRPLISTHVRSACCILLTGCESNRRPPAPGLRGTLACRRLKFLDSGARGGHRHRRETPASPTGTSQGHFGSCRLVPRERAGRGHTLQKGAEPKQGCLPAASPQVAPEDNACEPAPPPGTQGQPKFGAELLHPAFHSGAPAKSTVMMGKNSN